MNEVRWVSGDELDEKQKMGGKFWGTTVMNTTRSVEREEETIAEARER